MSEQAQISLDPIPLFAELNAREKQDILQIAKVVTFRSGEAICTEDEIGDCMFVILEGKAQVSLRADGPDPVPVGTIQAHEVAGELSLLDNAPRSANVIANGPVTALRIDRKDFNVLRVKLNPAAYKIMRRLSLTICDRLRSAMAHASGRQAPERKASSAAELPAFEPDESSLWKTISGWFGS